MLDFSSYDNIIIMLYHIIILMKWTSTGNPVLCDDNTKIITKAMELNHNAEVSGTSKCIPVTNDIKTSNLTAIDQSPITVIVT